MGVAYMGGVFREIVGKNIENQLEIMKFSLINPHPCGRRVTVISWSVCLSVCVSVTTKLLFKHNYLEI